MGRSSGLVLDAETSKRLGRIRQRDTAPEQLVRRALWAEGLRYRIGGKGLPGRPDVSNKQNMWAVFVHGCYWHSHRGCHRATVPKRNREFWIAKFEANRERDARVRKALRSLGYATFVVWECEAYEEQRLARIVRRVRSRLAARESGVGLLFPELTGNIVHP